MNGAAPHRASRAAGPPADPFDGVLYVDKPAGPTSHDIVAAIRRHFRLRKVGHGGTLDPQATGLLVILLGRGTKLSGVFLGSDKAYEGAMRLGVATDSYDADGRVTRERDPSGVTREQVEAEFARRTGDMMQTPPMVSAIKLDGVPLYKRAGRGETVERAARLIHVYEFRLVSFEPPVARFVMRCTKGTYVRSLCHEAGEALGCGAHLCALRRTRSGDARVEDAVPFDGLMRMDRGALAPLVAPLSRFAAKLPRG